jgi:predicted exporter
MPLTPSDNRVNDSGAVRKLAAAWSLLFTLLVITALYVLPGMQFETNILALLPHNEKNPLILKAQEKQNSHLNQSVIWLVGADTQENALQQAQALEKNLTSSGLFEEVQLSWNSKDSISGYQQFLPYRYNFMTAEDKAAINADAQTFANDSIQLLYSPLGMQHASTLLQDPLFTLGNYINSLNNSDIELYQDVAMMTEGDKVYALLTSKVSTNSTDTGNHDKLIKLYESSKASLTTPNSRLLVAGLPLYSAYGAQSAKNEISTIGTLSTVLVITLLLFAFRSIKPLALSIVSISVGILSALTVCNLIFDKVHVITLVFGSSLIGCIDYSFHYFCNSFQKDWNSYQGLKSIFTSISLGMLGSVIAFLSLAFTPFPGLQQMAVFSATGLFSAWLTVVLLFPFWSYSFSCKHPIPLTRFYPVYLEKWPAFFRKFQIIIILAGITIVIAGFSQLNIQDDIRSMQKTDPALLEQENAIKSIFKQKNDAQYFIVSGKNSGELLEKEKHLSAQLAQIIANKQLDSYIAISDIYPDEKTQLHNHALIKSAFFDSGIITPLFKSINMDEQYIHAIIDEMNNTTVKTLGIAQWLDAAPQNWKQQWLGCDAQQCASIINLKGIKNISALEALATPQSGIYFVDHVATINSIMHQYRIIAGLFVGIAAVIIIFMLCYALNRKAALTIIRVPLAAITLTIAIVGLLGTPFNLFNVFALILVLGIGFDYSIFHYLGEKHKQSTSLAVLLSLITTTLSFGLLMLSKTTVIQAFGLTLSIGIACAFLLSPLISVQQTEVSHE